MFLYHISKSSILFILIVLIVGVYASYACVLQEPVENVSRNEQLHAQHLQRLGGDRKTWLGRPEGRGDAVDTGCT